MLNWIGRAIFVVAVSACILLFTVGNERIRIDTNLQDFNPVHVFEPGAQFAVDTLTQDISQRFTLVLKGTNANTLTQAKAALAEKFAAQPALQVIDSSEIASAYLAELIPFQFNLLTTEQQQRLLNANAQAMAIEAQRKLYQFGDGIRLVPFADDPLGWFSDYLLSSIQQFDNAAQGAIDDSEAKYSASTFTVLIRPYPESMAEQQVLYQTIVQAIDGVAQQYDVQVLRSGLFFFAVDSAQSAQGDIQLIAIGSIVGVIVLMLVVFRSLLPLTLALTSIAIGIGFGILTSIWVFGSIHVLTIVFGASLIGIVVDYSLHYFYHFLAPDSDAAAVSAEATKTNSLGRAMALSVITSLVGYGALTLSDLLLLQKVALFSCSGLVLAWLSVMVLGPLVTRRSIVARQTVLVQVITAIQRLLARKPQRLAIIGLLSAFFGAVYLATANIATNDDPRRFFHVSAELIAQEQAVAELTQVYEPGRYFIVEGRSADDIYQTLNGFYQVLDNPSEQITSVLDWLPSPSEQQNNYRLQEVLYQDGGVLETFFGLLGMPPQQAQSMQAAYREHGAEAYLAFPELNQAIPAIPPLWIEHESSVYSFVLIKKHADLTVLENTSAQFANIRYVSGLDSAVTALQAQRLHGASLLVVAYGLIAVMLVLYYRQLSVILLLLIPSTASIITLAILIILGQAITVFHVMALFLVLGLGMDYIIFAKEMQHKRAITQQAILLSALTSLLSFGLLAFSSMPIVQAFGSTILIANSINFIAAICLFNQPAIQGEASDV
ncbi:MMPL family transporter [Alteromonas flava]|uniref:MMPL family transporter n=1 Tax=Alteromonas flava TaxID=2048003 RepID=UPI000C28CCF7|nr:MMPL family transporter [Alteromonas flava]